MKKIKIIIILLLITFFNFSPVSAAKESSPDIYLGLNGNENLPSEVIIKLEEAIKNDWKKEKPLTNKYFIGHVRSEVNWGIGTLVPEEMDHELVIIDHVSNFQVKNATTFVFAFNDSQWNVALECSNNISYVLNAIPNKELSEGIKESIINECKNPITIAVDFSQKYFGYKFPYISDNSFTLLRPNYYWHSDPNSAIDFGQNQDVYAVAVAPGYISSICANPNGSQAWIYIKTEDPDNPGQYLNSEKPLYLHN